MGEEKQISSNNQEMGLKKVQCAKRKSDEYSDDSLLLSSSSSSSSSSLSSSEQLADDASSSNSSSSSSSSSGPLYELAELMAQLPIKRGLSKFYNGKSQTFASLGNVKSLEDLAKKEKCSYNTRMKACRSYGGNLNIQHNKFGPKATITKRSSPKSSFSPPAPSFLGRAEGPMICQL